MLYLFEGDTILTEKDLSFSAKNDPMKKLGHHLSKTLGYPAQARNMAGPGHKPAIPHPSPNMASPIMSLLSMTLLVGTLKWPTDNFWLSGHSSAFEFLKALNPFTY
mmetsp:Transcript_9374/g.15289  ORF Transcript_9374/g.15289 Transcript_9374/m.15289 type:complete len:106 (-) Transcript_9374:836-1153(-)